MCSSCCAHPSSPKGKKKKKRRKCFHHSSHVRIWVDGNGNNSDRQIRSDVISSLLLLMRFGTTGEFLSLFLSLLLQLRNWMDQEKAGKIGWTIILPVPLRLVAGSSAGTSECWPKDGIRQWRIRSCRIFRLKAASLFH